MLLGGLLGTRVFGDWANDAVATIKPAASVDSNAMGFMTYLLLRMATSITQCCDRDMGAFGTSSLSHVALGCSALRNPLRQQAIAGRPEPAEVDADTVCDLAQSSGLIHSRADPGSTGTPRCPVTAAGSKRGIGSVTGDMLAGSVLIHWLARAKAAVMASGYMTKARPSPRVAARRHIHSA
jgi:hypothetical protein